MTSIQGNGLMELESRAYGLICHLKPLSYNDTFEIVVEMRSKNEEKKY